MACGRIYHSGRGLGFMDVGAGGGGVNVGQLAQMGVQLFQGHQQYQLGRAQARYGAQAAGSAAAAQASTAQTAMVIASQEREERLAKLKLYGIIGAVALVGIVVASKLTK